MQLAYKFSFLYLWKWLCEKSINVGNFSIFVVVYIVERKFKVLLYNLNLAEDICSALIFVLERGKKIYSFKKKVLSCSS